MGYDEIPLSLDELRQLSLWTAECAERALPLFEAASPGDRRARDAIEAVRTFGTGARRTKAIRTTAFAALKAAAELATAAAGASAGAAAGAAPSAGVRAGAGVGGAGGAVGGAVGAGEAAARAAVGAAGSAYLHPLAAGTQVKHVVAAAQYAAYAEELATGDPAAADAVVEWALERAPVAVREVIARYPEGSPGRGRLGELHRQLEAELRRPSTS